MGEFFQEGKLGFNAKELEQCELLFDTFDVDQSGTIDLEELRQVMWCLGACLSDEELTKLLAQIDLDQSGEVDREEFLFLIKLYKETCRFNTLYKSDVTAAHVTNAKRTTFLYPDDTKLWVWQVVVLLTTLYFMIVVTHADTQTYDTLVVPLDKMLPLHCVGTVVFFADIVIGAITLLPKQTPPESGTRVNMRYITTWLAVDLLSAIPFDIIFYYADVSAVATLVLSHVRMAKYIKVPFFFRQSERAVMTRHYVRFFYHQVPMIFTTFWWVTSIHILSCIWLALSQNDDYITAIYWVFYTITSVGYGDIAVDSTEKRIFACFLCIGGLIVNGVLAGILTAKMQRANIASEGNDKMMETLSLMKLFNVPDFLQEEILAFQQHLISHSLSAGVSKVVDKLPASIKDNIDIFIKVNFISEVDFFQRVPESCRITLAASLITTVFSPEEVVVLAGEKCATMYFVTHGFVDVLGKDGELVSTLSRGDSFGKDALIGLARFQYTVKAITYCSLLALPREDIIAAMKIYPDFDKIVRSELFEEEEDAREEDDAGTDDDDDDAGGSANGNGTPSDKNPLDPSAAADERRQSHRDDPGFLGEGSVPTTPVSAEGGGGDRPKSPAVHAGGTSGGEKGERNEHVSFDAALAAGDADRNHRASGADAPPARSRKDSVGADDGHGAPDVEQKGRHSCCTRRSCNGRTRYIIKRAHPRNRLSTKLRRHIELYVASMLRDEGRHIVDSVTSYLIAEATAERQRLGTKRDSATNRSAILKRTPATHPSNDAAHAAAPEQPAL